MSSAIPLESLQDISRPYILFLGGVTPKVSELNAVAHRLIFPLEMVGESLNYRLFRFRDLISTSKVTSIEYPPGKAVEVTDWLLAELVGFTLCAEECPDPAWKGPRSVSCRLEKQGLIRRFEAVVHLQCVPDKTYGFKCIHSSVEREFFESCPGTWVPASASSEIMNVDFLLSELDKVYKTVGAASEQHWHPSKLVLFEFTERQLLAVATKASLAYSEDRMVSDLVALRVQLQVILATMTQEVFSTVTHGKRFALNALDKLVDKMFPETAKKRGELLQREIPKVASVPPSVVPPSVDGTTLRITAAAMRAAFVRKWPDLAPVEAISKLRNASEEDQAIIDEVSCLFRVDKGEPASGFKSKESISEWCSNLAPRTIALIDAS